jgi:hypothetical protein
MLLCGRAQAECADVDFWLLELSAGAKVDGQFLAGMLAPTALIPDRLDYILPWLLLQALQAIQALSAPQLDAHVAQVRLLGHDIHA